MPTYAYACTACGHAFEIHQSFSDEALTVCPECEGRLRKVFSSVGVVFKGSGFYRNDARAGSTSSTIPAATGSATDTSAPAAPSGGSPSGGSSSGGSSSGGSAPAPSTAAKPAASA